MQSVFVDFTCNHINRHFHTPARRELSFLLREAEAFIVKLMLVLIDRARRDDSIGCHIAFWSNFHLRCENSGCRLDFQTADCFVAPFLAETFRKMSSNEAHYTPNR